MNDLNNPLFLVKALRGAPLSCMAVLCLTEQPVSRRWIETHTGYGSRVIRDALHHLENAGLAARAAQGWTLSAAARHLISKRLTG